MANFAYTRMFQNTFLGDIHLDTDDIRCLLVMTNTTADTEPNTTTLSGFTTLGEHDGTNYARFSLVNPTVTEDTTNFLSKFDANDETLTSLGGGTHPIQGAIVYLHQTDDTDHIPLFYIDSPSFPNSTGDNYVITWHANGIARLKRPA